MAFPAKVIYFVSLCTPNETCSKREQLINTESELLWLKVNTPTMKSNCYVYAKDHFLDLLIVETFLSFELFRLLSFSREEKCVSFFFRA